MLMKIGTLLFAVPGVVLLYLYNLDMSAIQECQQLQQFYDASTSTCTEQPQPTQSYYQRHSALVNYSMLASVLGGALITWGMLLRGLARAPEDRPS